MSGTGAERFLAAPPSGALLAQAERLAPTNPFVTAAYVDAQRALGFTPWMLGLERDGVPTCLTVAFLRRGRLSASLDVTSAPPCAADSAFWPGLHAFARGEGVGDLLVSSFASPDVHIPVLSGERARHARAEFLIDLHVEDLLANCARHHRTRIRKATGLGAELRRTREPAALAAHVALHNASIARRQERGEAAEQQLSGAPLAALLETGAGELFEAWVDGTLQSSVLVLRAPRGGYFRSSGSSPEGMKHGASHFVTFEIARTLQAEGMDVFNCSGARPHEAGLREFKERFGARPVELEAAAYDLRGGMQRMVAHAVGLARRARARLATAP